MNYLKLLRIHTLPLVFAAIGTGIFLALKSNSFSWILSFLLLVTASSLQIIANIANDYGDGLRGIDGADRIGFERLFQSGKISKKAIQTTLILTIAIAIICGVLLLFFALQKIASLPFLVWVLIGASCLWAALKYSLGNRPHSSTGLGDISVFIFFGPVAVIGSYFLLTQNYNHFLWLESSAIGLLIVSVLNLNNIRDLKSDKKKNRKTLAIRLGEKRAKIYQKILILTSFGIYLLASYYRFSEAYQWLAIFFFLPLIVLAFSLGKVDRKYNSLLKKQCLFILLFSVVYGISLNSL